MENNKQEEEEMKPLEYEDDMNEIQLEGDDSENNGDHINNRMSSDTSRIEIRLIRPSIRGSKNASVQSSEGTPENIETENVEDVLGEQVEENDAPLQLITVNESRRQSDEQMLVPARVSPAHSTDSIVSIGEDEKDMNHVVMKENRWADLYPSEVKNQFIKQVIEAMNVTNGKYQSLKKKLEKQMKTSTSLSVFKFDESFVELFLFEISQINIKTLNPHESFQRLIEDYLSILELPDFERISRDFKKFVNSCLLFLVRNKQCKPLCLRKFLNWYFFKIVHKFEFIKTQWNEWQKEMQDAYDDNIQIYMNEALIEACFKGKHEMVLEFLNKGFEISDSDFHVCLIGKEEHEKKIAENQFKQRHLKMFRVKSTPSYLLANFCYRYKKYKKEKQEHPSDFKDIEKEDPFSVTLHNLHIAKNMSVDKYDLAEYVKQLRNIIDEGREFLGDLISLCQNMKEAKLLLSHDSMLDHYELKHDLTDWNYGRLDEACLSKHMNMVTNDYSQRIFKETFCGVNHAQSPNISSSFIMDLLSATFLAPFHLVFYIFAYLPCKSFGSLESLTSRLKDCPPFFQSLFFHYSVPKNRCSSDIVCHLALICLIILTMVNPHDEPHKLDIDWYDVCLLVWTFGCLFKHTIEALVFVKDFFSCGEKSKMTHWTRSIKSIQDPYNLLQCLCCAFILLGKLFKFIGFLECSAQHSSEYSEYENSIWPNIVFFECTQDDPQRYCDNSYLKTGYSLIGVGSTLCILNLLYWFELNSKLGPIIVSLERTFGDILKIQATFLVFLFAFSIGLHFSLRLSNMYCKGEVTKINATLEARTGFYAENCNIEKQIESAIEGFSLEDNVNHFRNFRESMKTCLWSLFDPGHPEVIGCTQVFLHY